ncbi:Uncharacterised protein [Acinetobacter baumannii]|nr:Uncharacterised protein [Acinetobacter baumannii]
MGFRHKSDDESHDSELKLHLSYRKREQGRQLFLSVWAEHIWQFLTLNPASGLVYKSLLIDHAKPHSQSVPDFVFVLIVQE